MITDLVHRQIDLDRVGQVLGLQELPVQVERDVPSVTGCPLAFTAAVAVKRPESTIGSTRLNSMVVVVFDNRSKFITTGSMPLTQSSP